MKNITICIPAYNEEVTISKCIESIQNQSLVNINEILVGVNGSTDRTIEKVKKLSKTDNRIKIVDSPKGKPNAWNFMNNVATNNLRVFIDGDCFLEKLSIYNLINALEDYIMVGGTLNYITKGVGLLSYIIHYPNRLYPEYFDLCGALYVIDYKKLTEEMRKKSYNQMPINLIADDRWLVLISEKVNISRQAMVYTKACSIRDQIKRVKRMLISDYQLELEYADVYVNMNKFKKNKNKLKKEELKQMKLTEKFIYICILIPKKIINKYIYVLAKKEMKKEKQRKYVWEKITTSRSNDEKTRYENHK